MHKKNYLISLLVIGVILIAGIFAYFAYDKTMLQKKFDLENLQKPMSEPKLSEDKKQITTDNQVLLTIDDPIIFEFFKNKSQLCDVANLSNDENRAAFCNDQQTFKSLTSFKSIVISPDQKEIGFTIESQAQTPDTVAGIFIIAAQEIKFLTGYYLGNEFLSFSPTGKNFIYQGNCWEGLCGLYINDTATLKEKQKINSPEFIDERQVTAKFVKWLSDNEIEFLLGEELKRQPF